MGGELSEVDHLTSSSNSLKTETHADFRLLLIAHLIYTHCVFHPAGTELLEAEKKSVKFWPIKLLPLNHIQNEGRLLYCFCEGPEEGIIRGRLRYLLF